MGFPDSFEILNYVYYLLNYQRPYQGLQKLTRLTGISFCIASKNWAVSCMSWRCRNWDTSSRHCWNPLQKYSNWLGEGSQSFLRRCWCRWCTVSSSISAFSSFNSVSSSCRNKWTECDCVYAAAPHCTYQLYQLHNQYLQLLQAPVDARPALALQQRLHDLAILVGSRHCAHGKTLRHLSRSLALTVTYYRSWARAL